LAGCGLNWPLAIRSTSLCIARSSGEVALRDSLQARAGLVSQTQSQATVPIPSGYILRGRHINRSDLGRPAVPLTTGISQRPLGGVNTSHLAVPAPVKPPKHLPGIPPHSSHATDQRQAHWANGRSQEPARLTL